MIALLGRLAAVARRHGLGGALRLGRDAADRLFLAAGRPPLRVAVDGIVIRGFLRHRSFLAHLAGGDYEPQLRALYLEALGRADVVLDVGAHTGFYALLARQRHPTARIVAIEADPYNAAALRTNVRGSEVEVVEMAASNSIGRAQFRQNLGTVGSSLVERPGTGPTRTVDVATTTVDAVVGDTVGRSVVMKLDVEGAERQALAGASRTLREAQRVLALVEINPRALAAAGHTGEELVADLEQHGLHVEFIDEEQKMLVPPGAADRKGNLIARKG